MRELSLDSLFGNSGSFLDVSFNSEELKFDVFVSGKRFQLLGETNYVPTAEADNQIPIYVNVPSEMFDLVLQRMREVYVKTSHPLTIHEAREALHSALDAPVRQWNSLYIVFYK